MKIYLAKSSFNDSQYATKAASLEEAKKYFLEQVAELADAFAETDGIEDEEYTYYETREECERAVRESLRNSLFDELDILELEEMEMSTFNSILDEINRETSPRYSGYYYDDYNFLEEDTLAIYWNDEIYSVAGSDTVVCLRAY